MQGLLRPCNSMRVTSLCPPPDSEQLAWLAQPSAGARIGGILSEEILVVSPQLRENCAQSDVHATLS